jgi:hypothetical protein
MQLYRMRPFVMNCTSRTSLLGLLEPRVYYIESTEMWSLADFPRVSFLALACLAAPIKRTSRPLQCLRHVVSPAPVLPESLLLPFNDLSRGCIVRVPDRRECHGGPFVRRRSNHRLAHHTRMRRMCPLPPTCVLCLDRLLSGAHTTSRTCYIYPSFDALQVCQTRASHCGICKSKSRIYPFDIVNVTFCKRCQHNYHRRYVEWHDDVTLLLFRSHVHAVLRG